MMTRIAICVPKRLGDILLWAAKMYFNFLFVFVFLFVFCLFLVSGRVSRYAFL